MFTDIREVAGKSAANITYLSSVLNEGAVRYIQLRRIATSPWVLDRYISMPTFRIYAYNYKISNRNLVIITHKYD